MRPPRHVASALSALTLSLLAGCATGTAPTTPASQAPAVPAPLPAVSTNKPASPLSVEQRHRRLIGDWHGRQPAKEGGTVEWLMRRSGDGTFKVTFRNFSPAGRLTKESTEVGYWGVSGDLEMTHTLGWLRADGHIDPAPADDPYFWDAYRIIELTENRIRYVSVESGDDYVVTRVPVGSDFPPPSPKP